MRMLSPLLFSIFLLAPLQALAQSGGVAGSGSGAAGVTTVTAGSPKATMPGPPGTNSAGTAQSSGRGATIGSGTGSAAEDENIRAENRKIDQKLKSICRGC